DRNGQENKAAGQSRDLLGCLRRAGDRVRGCVLLVSPTAATAKDSRAVTRGLALLGAGTACAAHQGPPRGACRAVWGARAPLVVNRSGPSIATSKSRVPVEARVATPGISPGRPPHQRIGSKRSST